MLTTAIEARLRKKGKRKSDTGLPADMRKQLWIRRKISDAGLP